MDNEFPSNSKMPAKKPAPKAEPKNEKRVEKVVIGTVTTRKKPLGKRFSETFVGGDAKGAGSYVLFEVLIPAAKDMVADAMSQGMERMLFGEVRSTSRRGSGRGSGSYTAYNRMGGGSSRVDDFRSRREERIPSRRARATHDFDEIILETRGEAAEVLDGLFEMLSKYEVARVSDLYDLVGMPASFTDQRWGWEDLRGSQIHRIRGGYVLDLPRPVALDS